MKNITIDYGKVVTSNKYIRIYIIN